MQTTERRVAALELKATDNSLKIVVVMDGETQVEALLRVGLPPDAKRVVFLSPLDVML